MTERNENPKRILQLILKSTLVKPVKRLKVCRGDGAKLTCSGRLWQTLDTAATAKVLSPTVASCT